MNCQEVMELMQRHVDGDLNPEETSRMLDHVGHCPDCAAMLQRLIHLSRGLEQLPRVVPPYSLVDAILPELGNLEAAGMETAGEPTAVTSRGRRAGRVRNEWIGRLSGVAAVAIVVGLLLIGGPNLMPAGSGDGTKEAGSLPVGNKTEIQLFATNESAKKHEDAAPSADAKMVSPDTPVTSNTPRDPASSPSDEPSAGATTKATGAGAAASSSPSPSSSPEPDQAPDTPVVRDPVPDKGKDIAPPSEPPSSPPTQSIMQQPPSEDVPSPDGQWRALIREGQLQLIRTDDGSIAFESPVGDGGRSGLVWKEDNSAVSYLFVDTEGKSSSMLLDVSELKEKTAP